MHKKLFILLLIVLLAQACANINQKPVVSASEPPSSSVAQPSPDLSVPTVTPVLTSTSTTVDANMAPATSTPVLSQDFWKELPIVPLTVSDRVRELYQRGLLMGNDPNGFSKVGDCHSTNPYFLADYDLGPGVYQLGEYAYLEPTIEYFQGSFGRTSLAAKKGLSTAGVLAPLWSDWKQCSSNESPLDCEFRTHQPSFAIISLGTNEAFDVKKDKSTFEGRLRRIIEHSIDQGVVPILSTKADNDEGDHYINYVTAKLALEYELPLWNFWRAVQNIPQQGMRSADHLTFAPTSSYTDFSKPENLEYGMQMRNLTALQVLDVVRREVTQTAVVATATPSTVPTPAVVVHEAGETMISPTDGMPLVYIPAGEFEMGSTSGNPDSAPIHTVVLNGYWMDSTEVTNAMFANFLNAVGNQTEGGTTWVNPRSPLVQIFEKDGTWQIKPEVENYPIVGVSWYGAAAYCEWTGRRLPTEAEWEYAARGDDGRRFPWGNEVDCKYAHYSGCGKGTLAVDALPLGVSPFGIFNMAGNVAEWVNDRYAADYYQESPMLNPTGPSNGYSRVVRGGYWGDTYLALRSTRREGVGADKHNNGVGFRCALTP